MLRSAPVRVLTRAPVVLALELGGMYAFYLTDLFALAHAHPALMALVDLHMVLAGLLLSVVLVGRDPLPHRPGLVGSLLTLLVAAAGHDVLAKVMYARLLPAHAGSPDDFASAPRSCTTAGRWSRSRWPSSSWPPGTRAPAGSWRASAGVHSTRRRFRPGPQHAGERREQRGDVVARDDRLDERQPLGVTRRVGQRRPQLAHGA